MINRSSKYKRFLSAIGIGISILIILVYIGLPVLMGIITLLPGNASVGAVPAGYENVSLRTSDNISLQSWYHPPANGAVILLLHGAGGSRTSVQSFADMLVRHGYGVLTIDLRGHGESQGPTNRLGWQGTQDVGAGIDFLKNRSEVRKIGGLGISMGGEVLLGAASAYPAMQAVAADGATRRCTEELLALESERPMVRSFTARVMYGAVQLFSGQIPPYPLLQSMLDARGTQYFLIAGGEKALEVSFNQLFQSSLGNRSQLWIAPGVGHTEAAARYPDEYEKRLIDFFDRTLISTKPQ